MNAAEDGARVYIVPPASGTIPCEGATTAKLLTVAAAPWASREVVLDCARAKRAVWFDGRARGTVPPSPAVLANVTVRNGEADSGGCVRADNTMLEVSGCRLEGCSSTSTDIWMREGGGGVAVLMHLAASDAAVTIQRTVFADCRAVTRGGAVLVHFSQPAPQASVEVSACTIDRARASWGGGVFVQFDAAALRSSVTLTDSSFVSTTAESGGGAMFVEYSDDATNATLPVSYCSFASTSGSSGGTLYAHFRGDASGVAAPISHSTFASSTAVVGGAVYLEFAGNAAAASVAIAHSSFADVSAQSDGGAALVVFGAGADGTSTRIEHSNFTRTRGQHGGAVLVQLRRDAADVRVSVADSAFTGTWASRSGGAVHVMFVGTVTGATVPITNCVFTNATAGEHGGALCLATPGAGVDAAVTDSLFQHCSASASGGAMFALLSRSEAPLRAIDCDTTQPQARAWSQSSTLTVLRTHIRDASCLDSACTGGAIALTGGLLRFNSSTATRCAAAAGGGFLHTAGSASVMLEEAVVDGAWAHVGAFIHHQATGVLHLRQSLLREPGAPLSAHHASHGGASVVPAAVAPSAAALPNVSGTWLSCSVGHTFMDVSEDEVTSLEEWHVTSGCGVPAPSGRQGLVDVRAHHMQWQCERCPRGTYFLGAPSVPVGERHGRFSGHCRTCPEGATCEGGADARANPGMWATTVPDLGSTLDPGANGTTWPKLPTQLVRCAEGYCCYDHATCRRFDSCAGNRSGVLCGECVAGSVGTLGSAECRRETSCGSALQDVLYWPGTLLLMLAAAVWHVRAVRVQCEGAEGGEGGGRASSAAGLAKITFAFFQCFPLLLLGDLAAPSAALSLVTSVTKLFSFQLLVGGSEGVCLLGGLSPTGAEAVSILVPALLLLCVLPAVCWFYARFAAPALPPATIFAAAFTSLMLLTYSSVASAMTRLLTCVDVPGQGVRLLAQGGVECWTGEAAWQWVVVLWMAVSIVFVPMGVVVGGWLLRHGAISLGWFCAALLLPLSCIAGWGARGLLRRTWREQQAKQAGSDDGTEAHGEPVLRPEESARARAAVLAVLGAGYRAEVWWWDAVLLLRRLALVLLPLVLHQHPVLQGVAVLLVLVGCQVAHSIVRPMRCAALQAVETGYLWSLVIVAALAIRSGALLTTTAPAAQRDEFVLVCVATLLLAVPLPAFVWCVRQRWGAAERRAPDVELHGQGLRASLLEHGNAA